MPPLHNQHSQFIYIHCAIICFILALEILHTESISERRFLDIVDALQGISEYATAHDLHNGQDTNNHIHILSVQSRSILKMETCQVLFILLVYIVV